MMARLRSKNERMMLDLLDQIKKMPADLNLSSDEFDSIQVNLRAPSQRIYGLGFMVMDNIRFFKLFI